jgi:hypothetical protein
MSKVNVPEGMLQAVNDHHPSKSALTNDPGMYGAETLRLCLEAALEWQRENAPVPTEQEMRKLVRDCAASGLSVNGYMGWIWMVTEWVIRMYDDHEPKVPEEIKDLLVDEDSIRTKGQSLEDAVRKANERTSEAFRRGQKSKE